MGENPIRCGYHALFIELKRQKGGTLSANQKQWLGKLLKAGNLAVWCNGFDEAKAVIVRYLKGARNAESRAQMDESGT